MLVSALTSFSSNLDNDQLDAHLLYFTIRPLQSSTCFEHYMLIIRRLNCIDAASDIVPCKQVSCLGLLEYNLLHCLYTITPSEIFQLRI